MSQPGLWINMCNLEATDYCFAKAAYSSKPYFAVEIRFITHFQANGNVRSTKTIQNAKLKTK